MVLDSIGGVLDEQQRIYRLCCNGHLKPSEMGQMLSGLREIRQSVESLPPEPETYQPPSIRIIEVPSDHFFTGEQLREMGHLGPIDSQRVIEHSPSPALRELEGEIAEARAGLNHHEPIVEPPLMRAPADVRDGTVVHHGLHLVKTSREVLEERLAALPTQTLLALAGVDDADES